jgi:DNA-binding MarR family transcriptional regulator
VIVRTETRDPLALESQVCFALSLASRSVVNAYRPVLEPLNLTHPQYLVMLALWQHGQLSLKQLAELLGLEPATASPLVKRLEAVGYVHRERVVGDERTLRISLTGEGRALREQAETIPATMMGRLGMDEDELIALHAAMTRVINAAARIAAHGGP